MIAAYYYINYTTIELFSMSLNRKQNVLWITSYNNIRYMNFKYGSEPVLIQRKLIAFKAILEIVL